MTDAPDPQTADLSGETPAAVLRVAHLSKHFGPTVALRDAGLEVRAGEIHALLGENGSGKSTLVKILSGVHSPSGGTITVGAQTVDSFAGPRAAHGAGVMTVFQEVLSVGSRTVLDNLWLGADGTFTGRIRRSEKVEKARAVLAELLEDPPSLTTLVEDLTLSERQVCSIARALLRDPRLLILDEATSALDYDSRSRLFDVVRRLRDRGVGVILITHRMDEIEEIGDRITVLRSGVTVGTVERGDWSTDQLVSMMTGDEHLAPAEARAATTDTGEAPVVLAAEDVRLSTDAAPFSAQFRRGELVGLAGLEGQGQDVFLRALAGFGAAGGRVLRVEGDRRAEITGHHQAHAERIAYVPRERGKESLLPWMSVQDNFALPTIGADARGGLVDPRATARRLSDYVSLLSIKLGRATDAITTLSGGNQQKVVVARWLATDPQVLLLNDPTRGIDIGAKRDLYRLLRRLTEDGTTVVMLSTEVDEHIELMDRVLVFREFTAVRELPRADLTRQRLVSSFFDDGGAS